MAGGRSFHYAHGRQVVGVRLVQTLGWVMLFMALALGVVGLTLYALR